MTTTHTVEKSKTHKTHPHAPVHDEPMAVAAARVEPVVESKETILEKMRLSQEKRRQLEEEEKAYAAVVFPEWRAQLKEKTAQLLALTEDYAALKAKRQADAAERFKIAQAEDAEFNEARKALEAETAQLRADLGEQNNTIKVIRTVPDPGTIRGFTDEQEAKIQAVYKDIDSWVRHPEGAARRGKQAVGREPSPYNASATAARGFALEAQTDPALFERMKSKLLNLMREYHLRGGF